MVNRRPPIIRLPVLILFVAATLQCAGCGYSNKTVLPNNIKTINIPPIKNGIDLTGEISDKDRFRVYRPGLEVDLTNAIINRFIFDGNLKVATNDKADAIVEAKLVDYRRDPLRYSEGDDIQEYRLSVTVNVTVYLANGHKVLWHEDALTGDTSFFLSGARALSEDQASAKAVEDVARRVVDKTIELW